MIKNFLSLALKNLIFRPLRTWLTIIGIVIGITLVVIILSLSSGIKNTITSTLQMFGSNLISVMPGKETNPLVGLLSGEKFREKDLEGLKNINGVEFIAPEDLVTVNVEFNGEKKSVLTHAVYWEETRKMVEQSQGFSIAHGTWPSDNQTSEVILGSKIASTLYKTPIHVGDEVLVKSKRMKVVGIFSPIGESTSDNILFISFPIFQNLTGRNGAMSVNIQVAPDANIDLVAKQVRFELAKQEIVQDFVVLTPKNTEKLAGNILNIIELILIIFAIISLIVGAVGIMNTMYTSVMERTKQIGIMKAVGASSDAISFLFLIESGFIGLVAGILGIVLGVAFSYSIGFFAGRSGIHGLFSFASLDVLGLFSVLIITFVIGVIAGILPARKAAKMQPAEALRYE